MDLVVNVTVSCAKLPYLRHFKKSSDFESGMLEKSQGVFALKMAFPS